LFEYPNNLLRLGSSGFNKPSPNRKAGRRGVLRQDIQGRKTRRPAHRVAGQARDGHQHENRQSTRSEIVSFMGNIYVDDKGQSVVHKHGSVALQDGTVKGGHWWEAHVSIVAVVFVTEEESAP
jgi:hypothetical protein